MLAIIEECGELTTSLVLIFNDFRKVFNSVHRLSIWKILEAYGIPVKVARVLTYLYKETESSVRVGIEHRERISANT